MIAAGHVPAQLYRFNPAAAQFPWRSLTEQNVTHEGIAKGE